MLGAKMARWTLACVVGLALVAGAATPCLAADRPPTRECWQLMSRAAELERQGRWEECIPLWRHIVAIEAPYGDDTALLRLGTFWQKIARTCDRLGRYPDAVDAYEQEVRAWRQLAGVRPEVTAEWYRYDLARIEGIRTEFEVYREVPAPAADGSGGTGGLAKYEPAAGSYLGGCFELDPAVEGDPSRAAAAYGRPHAAFLVYVDWGDPIPEQVLSRAAINDVALQVALQPQQGLDAVGEGPYLEGLLRRLSAFGRPVFLRFGAEMNGNWTPWSGDAQLYIEKFRLVAKAARRLAPNVAMVWAPNHAPEENIEAYYPGDECVDWVGVNFYCDYYMSGDPGQDRFAQHLYHQGKLASPLEKLDYVYALYSDKKPIMVCEFGIAHRSVTTGEDVTDWALRQLGMTYGYLPLRFPRVKAAFYFSVDQASPSYRPANRWSNYCLSANRELQDRYRELTRSPYFLSRVGESSPLAHRPLEEAGLIPGPNRLLAYARMAYPFAGRVECLWDGVKVVESDQAPFVANLEVPVADGRVHYLLVRATSADGRQVQEVLYAVDPCGRVVRQGTTVPPRAVFPDLGGHWSRAYVERLASLGVVGGFPDGSFRPDAPVTRAQFLKMLWRALGLEAALRERHEVHAHLQRALGTQAAPAVAGVPEGHWIGEIAASAVEAGVLDLSLYPRGFTPDEEIPRWEMAVLAARALGLQPGQGDAAARASTPARSGETAGQPPTTAGGFADEADIPAVARASAAAVKAAGIMTGDPAGRFLPLNGARRGEAAKVIVTALEARARPSGANTQAPPKAPPSICGGAR